MARNREVSREGNQWQAEISLLAMCGLCSSSHILKMTEIRDEKDVTVILKNLLKSTGLFSTVSSALPNFFLKD